MSNVTPLDAARRRRDVHIGFSARELDTDDEREWDAICYRVEEELRRARDAVLRGSARSISLTIHVHPDRAD